MVIVVVVVVVVAAAVAVVVTVVFFLNVLHVDCSGNAVYDLIAVISHQGTAQGNGN